MYKSFGGYNNFMASYGLKPWSDSDYEEGKAIIEAFKQADASNNQNWNSSLLNNFNLTTLQLQAKHSKLYEKTKSWLFIKHDMN